MIEGAKKVGERMRRQPHKWSCQFAMTTAYMAVACLCFVDTAQPANEGTKEDSQPQPPIVCALDQNKETGDCLSRLKGLATRSGDTLRLILRNGRTKVYTSDQNACDQVPVDFDKCVVFLLLRYYPSLQLFLVSKSFYECGHYELVSRRTGSVLEISTIPELSPSGKYIVSVDDSDACDRKYDLAIWSTKTDPPTLEFKYQTQRYENWAVVGWEGDDVMKLKALVNSREAEYDQDAQAIRSKEGWKLVLGKRVDRVRQEFPQRSIWQPLLPWPEVAAPPICCGTLSLSPHTIPAPMDEAGETGR